MNSKKYIFPKNSVFSYFPFFLTTLQSNFSTFVPRIVYRERENNSRSFIFIFLFCVSRNETYGKHQQKNSMCVLSVLFLATNILNINLSDDIFMKLEKNSWNFQIKLRVSNRFNLFHNFSHSFRYLQGKHSQDTKITHEEFFFIDVAIVYDLNIGIRLKCSIPYKILSLILDDIYNFRRITV